MTTNDTPRWSLPLLAAGQAQKEMTHNEALSLLDLVVHPCVRRWGQTCRRAIRCPVRPGLSGTSRTAIGQGVPQCWQAGPMGAGDSCFPG